MMHMQKLTRPSSAQQIKPPSHQKQSQSHSNVQNENINIQNYQSQAAQQMKNQLKINKDKIRFIPQKKKEKIGEEESSRDYEGYSGNRQSEVFEADISSISLPNRESFKCDSQQNSHYKLDSSSQIALQSIVNFKHNNQFESENMNTRQSQNFSKTTAFELPPKIKQKKIDNGSNKENLQINIQQVVAKQVQERCQKLLESAKKVPPKQDNNQNRQGSTNRKELTINSEVRSNLFQQQPNTPSAKGGSTHKNIHNSIRKLQKDSQEKQVDTLSTARNYNPLDNNDLMNTARSNLITNFQSVDNFRMQSIRKSSLRDSIKQSTHSLQSNAKQKHQRRVSFCDQDTVFEIEEEDLDTSNDEFEIERKFRMYFKVEGDDQNKEEVESYDPLVCNMNESSLWKSVFEQLNLKYSRKLTSIPITQLDILLEKEFYEVRKLQLYDEDLHLQTVEVVDQLEELYNQNEDLTQQLEELKKKENDFKKIYQPRNVKKIESIQQVLNYNEQSSEEQIEIIDDKEKEIEIQKEDDFETQWQKLDMQRKTLDHVYSTQTLPLEQSFQQDIYDKHSNGAFETSNRNQSSNFISNKGVFAISNDTTFMDVNDSFYQQFDGLIPNNEKQLPPSQKQKSNTLVKDQVKEYKSVVDKPSTIILESTTVERKVVLTSKMKAFEQQYAKYEQKLKMIEEELQDYNTKSRQLESSTSPVNRNRFITQQSTESPQNHTLRSPKSKNGDIFNSNSKNEQETPQFNKTQPFQNKLSQIVW